MAMPNQIGLGIYQGDFQFTEFLFADYGGDEVKCRKAMEVKLGELVAKSAPKYDAHFQVKAVWKREGQ